MKKILMMLVMTGTACGAVAQANPFSAQVKRDYEKVREMMIRSAEKMPEGEYGFKPTPEVRSFGQIVGHIADDQYNLCGPVRGDVREGDDGRIEKTVHGKDALVVELRKAFAYCDAAYAGLTDASAMEKMTAFGAMRTRYSLLEWNMWHTWEHYGNLVVYLRMKGLVPPSSEPAKPQLKLIAEPPKK